MSARNAVPACVSAPRLDAFLRAEIAARGHRLKPEFHNIARYYEQHGRRHRVRWDYAFFQMALETNFLSFRRGDGRPGDVDPRQNNFAGLGTTGGGVKGDSYPDVSTGVLAQIQHLVVYSGERVANPAGHRTRLKQDVILQSIAKIARNRPVTFADLARRWAADRHYGRSIERLAGLFYAGYCKGPPPAPERPAHSVVPERVPPPAAAPPRRASTAISKRALLAPKGGAPRNQQTTTPPRACTVEVASFGGARAVLIQSAANDAVRLTALSVQPGFEDAMAANFIANHAPMGRTIGAYPSRTSALARAHAICSALSAASN